VHNFGTCVWRTDAQWQLPKKNVFRRRKNRITFRRHASHPRAAADGGVDRFLVRSPREVFFQKSSGQILPSGTLREASPPGYATQSKINKLCPEDVPDFF